MEKKNWKKRLGLILMVVAVTIIAIEIATGNALADVFGRLFCGDRYMVIVEGHFGDGVCGFNADIQLIMASFLTLFIGIVFLFLGRRRKKAKK